MSTVYLPEKQQALEPQRVVQARPRIPLAPPLLRDPGCFPVPARAYFGAMLVLEATQDVPLSVSEDGTIRIACTRVSLDSVVHHYQQGATAEEIVLRFPALRLADIHFALAYYLNHQDSIGEYIEQQRQEAEELRQRISADPVQQNGLAQMRERIKERAAARRQNS
jgi:uncharacterized protein (DUF433 family)